MPVLVVISISQHYLYSSFFDFIAPKFTRHALDFDAATDQGFKDFTISVLKPMMTAATVIGPIKAVLAVLGAMNVLAFVVLSSDLMFRQSSSRP